MTVHRLSAQSVKVQLTADELNVFLTDAAQSPDSPQMLRLLSFMLAKAESASGIPFSDLPVTVELLSTQDGGLAAYFTAQALPDTASGKGHAKTVRLAARFPEQDTLKACCRQLRMEQPMILTSMLSRYRSQWILSLKLRRDQANAVHHLLLEYGSPFRLSALNRARLSEYGECICEKDAIRYVLGEQAG